MVFGPRKLVNPAKAAKRDPKIDKWNPPLRDGTPRITQAPIEPNAVSEVASDPWNKMTRKPRG